MNVEPHMIEFYHWNPLRPWCCVLGIGDLITIKLKFLLLHGLDLKFERFTDMGASYVAVGFQHTTVIHRS